MKHVSIYECSEVASGFWKIFFQFLFQNVDYENSQSHIESKFIFYFTMLFKI